MSDVHDRLWDRGSEKNQAARQEHRARRELGGLEARAELTTVGEEGAEEHFSMAEDHLDELGVQMT